MINAFIEPYILGSGIINLGFWIVVFALTVVHRRMPIYHPFLIFMLYHFVGFILRPFSVYSEEWSFIWNRIGFVPGPDDIVRTTIVTNLALVACYFGLIYKSKPVDLIPPTEFVVKRDWRFIVAVVLLSAAGLYSTYRAYGSAGLDSVNGFNSVVDASGGRRLQDISGYTLALAEFLPIVCIMLVMTRRYQLMGYIVSGLFVLVRIYVGAQRLSFVVVLAAIFFNSLIAGRRRVPTARVVLLLACMALLFDFVGHDRLVFRRVLAGEANISAIWTTYFDARYNSEQSSAMDIVEYESATAAMSLVENYSGYSYGTQYLRILIWPIPRQLWNDKPVYTSIVNLNAYGFDFSSLTYSLYADLYMAFGYAFVTIVMFFFGRFLAYIYEIAARTHNPAAYAFFWIVVVYLNTILRDGGTTFVYFWGFSFIAAAVLIWAGQLRLERSATSAGPVEMPVFRQGQITGPIEVSRYIRPSNTKAGDT